MGRDKAFVPCSPADPSPLLARQLRILGDTGISDLIVAGRADADYSVVTSGARVVTDAVPLSGPLAGLAAVLAAARHPWVVVVAVDLPQVTRGYLEKLIAAGDGRVGVVPEGPAGYEPLVALYPRDLLPEIQSALASRRLGLQTLVREAVAAGRLRALPIAVTEYSLFTNWNTPEDLQAGQPSRHLRNN
jgi:molybdopterin-guanine dinucleotide biosynthesis protein A